MKERTMPAFRLSRLAILVLISSLLGACQSEDPTYPEAPEQIEPLELRRDDEGLQAPIQLDQANVRFQVPARWAPLDSVAAMRAYQSVAIDTVVVHTQLLRVVGEQRTSSFLVVSRLDAGSAGDVIATVQRTVAAQNPNFVRADTLRQSNQGLLVDLVIASRTAVHHKVLMRSDDGSAVQFGYVTPRFQYPRIAPLIAASVASIQRAE
jgi:hypothetical protein